LLPLIDAIPPIRGLRGHPLQRPRVVYADRGYDSERHRRALRDRGIEPVIAKRRTEHGSGLGKYRWVVERTHAWLHHFRRLRIRFERRADIHGAFLKLGCCLICWNTLRRADQSNRLSAACRVADRLTCELPETARRDASGGYSCACMPACRHCRKPACQIWRWTDYGRRPCARSSARFPISEQQLTESTARAVRTGRRYLRTPFVWPGMQPGKQRPAAVNATVFVRSGTPLKQSVQIVDPQSGLTTNRLQSRGPVDKQRHCPYATRK
jgi:transposase